MLDSPDPRFETLNDLTTKYYRPQFDKTFNPGMFCAPTMWSIHPLTPDFLWLCGTSNTADGCKHFCVTSLRCKSDNCHISCMCLLKPQSYLRSQPVSWFLHKTQIPIGKSRLNCRWATIPIPKSNLWVSRLLSWEVLLQLLEKGFLKQFGALTTDFQNKLHWFYFSLSGIAWFSQYGNTCSLLGSERKSNLKVSTTSAFSWRSNGSWKK